MKGYGAVTSLVGAPERRNRFKGTHWTYIEIEGDVYKINLDMYKNALKKGFLKGIEYKLKKLYYKKPLNKQLFFQKYMTKEITSC